MNAVIEDECAWRHTLATITGCVTTATITGGGLFAEKQIRNTCCSALRTLLGCYFECLADSNNSKLTMDN